MAVNLQRFLPFFLAEKHIHSQVLEVASQHTCTVQDSIEGLPGLGKVVLKKMTGHCVYHQDAGNASTDDDGQSPPRLAHTQWLAAPSALTQRHKLQAGAERYLEGLSLGLAVL